MVLCQVILHLKKIIYKVLQNCWILLDWNYVSHSVICTFTVDSAFDDWKFLILISVSQSGYFSLGDFVT